MRCPHYLDGTFAGPFLPTRSCNDGDESIAKMVPLTQERPDREEIEIRRRVRLLDPTLHEGEIDDRMLQTCPVILSTANASIRIATAGGLRIDVMHDTNIPSGVAFPYSSNTVGLSRAALRLLLPVVPALPGDPREQHSLPLECV